MGVAVHQARHQELSGRIDAFEIVVGDRAWRFEGTDDAVLDQHVGGPRLEVMAQHPRAVNQHRHGETGRYITPP